MYKLEPNESQLKGKIAYESFKAQSIRKPNENTYENVFILYLNEPAAIEGLSVMIDAIQLNNMYRIDLMPFVNKTVIISGTLWKAHTSHHFTPILIDVLSITPT